MIVHTYYHPTIRSLSRKSKYEIIEFIAEMQGRSPMPGGERERLHRDHTAYQLASQAMDIYGALPPREDAAA